MFDNIVRSIRAEAKAAKAGKPSRIVAKVNALLEPLIIAELYKASQAGVKIDGVVITDRGLQVLPGTFVLQVGKRRFMKIHLQA
jgi:polyphosphate kinase